MKRYIKFADDDSPKRYKEGEDVDAEIAELMGEPLGDGGEFTSGNVVSMSKSEYDKAVANYENNMAFIDERLSDIEQQVDSFNQKYRALVAEHLSIQNQCNLLKNSDGISELQKELVDRQLSRLENMPNVTRLNQ